MFHYLMSSALAKNICRNHGEVKVISSDIIPICPGCKRPMGICKRSKVKLVGLHSTYVVSIPTYGCRKSGCIKRMKHLITPPNPYAGPRMTYDYETQTEVVRIRWQEHATYNEISIRLADRFEISIDHTAVELILKTYENASAETFRESYLQTIKSHGGTIICVDVMEPLKGRKGILVAHDYWTGLTLGVLKMPNGKQETYENFFVNLKVKIASQLCLPIIGVISDALPAQRKAIEAIFDEIPHCLCHYHFYNLVLKAPKLIDSSIVTQIRAALRGNYDLKQYQIQKIRQKLKRSQYELLQPLFEPLVELSHWKRKPKDPCFTGMLLYSRLTDLLQKFQMLSLKVEKGTTSLPKHNKKVLRRITEKITVIIQSHHGQIEELLQIHLNLDKLVQIFDQSHENAEMGLEKLIRITYRLYKKSMHMHKDSITYIFINALKKYTDTKGKLLFNYREISDGPTTNNFQELKFKQIKHFLRRVIGHGAAREYLMAHAEQIMFVNPNETRESIFEILKSCDQASVRNKIKNNRRNLDAWVFVVHHQVKWENIMNEIEQYILNL